MTPTPFVRSTAAVGLFVVAASTAAAQSSPVVAAGVVPDPATFAYVWDGHGRGTRPVGVGLWTAEAGEFAPGFWAFDAGRPGDPPTGRPYTFAVRPGDHPDGFGPPEGEAVRRAGYVRALLGRVYPKDGWTADPAAARAAQVAVWEIASEDRPPVTSADRFGLFDGTFRADYPTPEAAPDFVRRAQTYLSELTGDDRPFRQHPAFSRFELVQLTAYPEPDVVRYQRVGSVVVPRPYNPCNPCNPCIPCTPCGVSTPVWERTVSPGARGPTLFAVRPVDVPAVGGGGAAGPTAAGFGPGGIGGGFGAGPVGGLGGFGGLGAGGLGAGGLGGGGGFVPVSTGDILTPSTGGPAFAPFGPTGTTPTPTVPVGTGLGSLTPPRDLPGVPVPPLGGPTDTPPTVGGTPETPGLGAVPAPAGIVLAFVGLGAMAGWVVTSRIGGKNARELPTSGVHGRAVC